MFDDFDGAFYERHMPHYQPAEAEFHVMFRLYGSLPIEAIEQMRAERTKLEKEFIEAKRGGRKLDGRDSHAAYFAKFDKLLSGATTGPTWLGVDKVAEIVREAIHFRDGKEYDLFAYTIMPNHVHMIMQLLGGNETKKDPKPLFRILQSLKRNTALACNRALGRSGAFWQDESYDHVIVDGDELARTIWYILENPVKAGLVKDWKEWQWSYVKVGLIDE